MSLLLPYAALFLSALLSLVPGALAGLSFGGVTSTNACYDALVSARSASDGNRLDRDAYVSFVNELSDGAFTSFQYNELEGGWGMYPATEFNQLPPLLRNAFYRHACGGAFIICDAAYLYADGADTGRDPAPDAQQEVYLFQVCLGVESAIDEAMPPPTAPATKKPSAEPTASPTTGRPTASPAVVQTVTVPLSFQVVVSGDVTAEQLASPGDETRQSLLLAMTLWSNGVARGYFDPARRKKRRNKPPKAEGGDGRRRRRLGEPEDYRDRDAADPGELGGDGRRDLIGYAVPLLASPPTDVTIVEDGTSCLCQYLLRGSPAFF